MLRLPLISIQGLPKARLLKSTVVRFEMNTTIMRKM